MDEKSSQNPPLTDEEKFREALILGHFIKYNVYLLAKAHIFSAIYANLKSTRDAIAETDAVMKYLDKPKNPPKSKKT